jgi:hypothetical protein
LRCSSVRSFRIIERDARTGGVDDDEFMTDFVDVLVDLEGEDKLSDSDMIAVLWVRM